LLLGSLYARSALQAANSRRAKNINQKSKIKNQKTKIKGERLRVLP
jgi:hypothetical protein